MSENVQRGLAAIVSTDVVGYSRMMGEDEDGTLAELQRHRDIVFDPKAAQHHGRIVKLMGDGTLMEFTSVIDAVRFAVDLQIATQQHNAGTPEDRQIVFRIGINVGDIVHQDDDIYGDGVNVAARIEALAEPGGICISRSARDQVRDKLDLSLVDQGEIEVKNISRPVRVFRVLIDDKAAAMATPVVAIKKQSSPVRKPYYAAVLATCLVLLAAVAWWQPWKLNFEEASDAHMALELPDKPSIAVLPFDNMSGDPAQDYFADGITEDLTTDLSRISGLFVVARNSSFSYKGRSVDVRTVSHELGVRYVLEGSVRRSGDQIRINAQLIDGSSGGHLWAERFDGTMADVFVLQDHVNRKIVAALEVNLTAADEKRFDQVETSSPEAYDLLLRGIEKYNRRSRDTIAEARDLFKQAVTLDPNYARAYANIALTYGTELNRNWTQERERSTRLGLEFAEKALAIDDGIPQIYMTRSLLYLSQRKHQTALQAAQRTIEVHPNYTDGHASLAFIQSFSGQLEAAIESLDRAKEINPLGTAVYLEIEGRVLFLLGRYGEALSILEEAVQRNPALDRIHLILAATYAELGRLEDADWSVDEALFISPDISLAKERRGANYMRATDLDHYIEALRKAGVPE